MLASYSSFRAQRRHDRSLRLMPIVQILMLCLLLSAGAGAGEAKAASAPKAVITKCAVTGSNKVTVRAAIKDPSLVKGKKVYLFTLPVSRERLKKSDKPLKAKKKKSTVTFKVKLNAGSDGTRLYNGFVLAEKTKKGYKAISKVKYISNPTYAAKYTYAFPTGTSKKGLQVASSMREDAEELGVSHATLNIDLAAMIASSAEYNSSSSYSMKYHGKTYWFRKSAIDSYDTYLESLAGSGTVVSAILLLSWRDDLKSLIYPSGRKKGHSFYAWNTKNASARKTLAASLTFLAKRYGGGSHGRIVGWIVGNEVNNYKVYNYAGKLSLASYAAVYAQAFRLTSQTVKAVYSKARVYISLDHLWNYKVSGAFKARSMLDAFAAKMKSYGMGWNLAYHPYSSPLTEPKFWVNANKQVKNSLDSPVINMANLTVLTNYIKKTYGTNTRIILSEQGYTSVQNKKDTQTAQAAAIAYSYLLTESNDMVDSFIMNRHVDHQVEVKQGLNLGLWATSSGSNPEWASSKKQSYDVFKYMDTDRSTEVTSFALKVIGISSWNDVISNYQTSLTNKRSAVSKESSLVSQYTTGKSLANGWKRYGAASSSTAVTGGLTVKHAGSRNRNAQWGAVRTGAVSFGKNNRFYAKILLKGSSASTALLKIRFYSGKNTLESDMTIPTGKTICVSADLSDWTYKNSVTKIQVIALPKGTAKWKSGASLKLTYAAAG